MDSSEVVGFASQLDRTQSSAVHPATVPGTEISDRPVQDISPEKSGRPKGVMDMKRTIIAIGVFGLLLAACSSSDSASETFMEIGSGLDSGGEVVFNDDGTEQVPVDEERLASSQTVNLDIAVSADRKVIRNVSLQLEADDTRATYDEIVRIAEAAGGFVGSAEVSPVGEDLPPHVFVTVRLPSANLTDALAKIKDTANEVISESQGAQDVTESFIDLEAQLANLTILETELRALLTDVRAQPDADPEKLLRVFSEISNTRGQIEQIQGQLNYLNDAVDLATVNISIDPTPAAIPIVEEGWAPAETARDASRELVAGLQSFADWMITFTIAVLPLLLLFLVIPGLVVFVAYRFWKNRKPNRPAGGTPEPLPSE